MTLVILLFRSTLLSLINLTKEMQMSKRLSAVLAGLVVLTASANAAELNAYSIMPEKYASQIFAEFTKDTGIKVNFLRFSTGEALARLNAEKTNPQVDVMLGGPADTYAAGVKEGIFELRVSLGSDIIRLLYFHMM